ncbi:hypothetical protein ACFQL4_26615 [Halosimplex aquaticum]
MQLIFNFTLTDYLFLALATERAGALDAAVDQLHLPPEHGQWANFLRNLDELNLEWLSEGSAGPSSTGSRPTTRCRSTAAGAVDASRRCSTTAACSNWPTASCSRCPGRR